MKKIYSQIKKPHLKMIPIKDKGKQYIHTTQKGMSMKWNANSFA